MKNKIDRFRLEYNYLSNFYPVCVRVEGLEYLSAEAAYQAAKCARQEDRAFFTELGVPRCKAAGEKTPAACRLGGRKSTGNGKNCPGKVCTEPPSGPLPDRNR